MNDRPSTWQPEHVRLTPSRLVVAWLLTGLAVGAAAAILPGVDIASMGGALLVAVVVGLGQQPAPV